MGDALLDVLHRIITELSGNHLLLGSGFAFPSKRLSVSSKAFKSMAALTAAPAARIFETSDNSQSSKDSTYNKTILK